MDFEIRYLASYDYGGEVLDSLNALRVTPTTDRHQHCQHFGVQLTPEARLERHTDYFGTEVIEFEIARPHRQLTIDARGRVGTRAPGEPPEAGWEALDSLTYRELGAEFLLQTDHPADHPKMRELIDITGAAASPLAAVLAASDSIPERFEYRPGATYVHSTVSDLLEGGAGVCQDFVHLALSVLRHLGIAARYVSGYLFAAHGEDGRESVEVDTHAWLEALLPVPGQSEPVWVGADPTNRGLTGENHVKIGHGRRYSDVPPIKGVYRGAATASHRVRVTMTALNGAASASLARP